MLGTLTDSRGEDYSLVSLRCHGSEMFDTVLYICSCSPASDPAGLRSAYRDQSHDQRVFVLSLGLALQRSFKFNFMMCREREKI